jgi:hypothetical protein
VPRSWTGNGSFITFTTTFQALTAKKYFFVTGTASPNQYTAFANIKSVAFMVEAPGIGGTEFSNAAFFWNWLHNTPTPATRAAPFSFRFVFGVTSYPTVGNQALLNTLQTANVNVIGTGAEGGISTALLAYGTMMDGNDGSYWYAVDWVQIQIDLANSNAVINGSNNPAAPLYYNQQGINVLQNVAANVMNTGIEFGLVLGQVVQTTLDAITLANNLENDVYVNVTVINAVPFITYVTEAPGDYPLGRYAGFTIVFIPTRGFKQVVFNVIVSSFVAL